MPPILTDFSEPALIQAVEANQESLYNLLSYRPQTEIADSPALLRVYTGVPHPIINGIVRTRLAESEVEAAIQTNLDYFRSRQMPYMWMVTPNTRPADLSRHLLAHGLSPVVTMPGMTVDLQALPPAPPLPQNATIREVTDEHTLADWTQVASMGFEMPVEVIEVFASLSPMLGYGEQAPLRNFVAYQEGEPIGTSSLYLGAGVAGLYTVSVLPRARKQGIGAALTVTPLQIAREAGYRIGILLASAMGAPIYRRLGFEERGAFTIYGGGFSTEQEDGSAPQNH